MDMPNMVIKESPNMQLMGYSLMVAKIEGDAGGHVGQVLARNEWFEGYEDVWLYRGSCQAKQIPSM